MLNNEIKLKSDNELVTLTLSDTKYIEHIIERYELKLSRYIKRTLLVNKEDVEDILQEVFIKVYKNLNSFNNKYKFSSWIYRITYNECIDFYRKFKKNKNTISFNYEDNIISQIASDINLEEESNIELNKDIVKGTLLKLGEKYRSILILRYIEEKDYNEISEILKLPIGTVGSLINRAKKSFKTLINYEQIK